jgi:hypothetical protein
MSRRQKVWVPVLVSVITVSFFITLLGGQPRNEDQSFTPLSNASIAVQGGEIGDLLRKWASDGTAAGNSGDYYDNRDGGHSPLNPAPYPQLQRVEYTEAQIKARQNWGMQKQILPFVVFGNSSTSASPRQGGSNVRSYYAIPDGVRFLFTQYFRNNLYIYPEHQDHDPGHNGLGGYGDIFPTNTPYLITSQGSSGSDQPFMRALPYVLAAFRPEVKRKLIETGLLMPAIQMILRSTNKRLRDSSEYLTGKAHPTVFQGGEVDALEMVKKAHGITLSSIPPIAMIRVVQEESPIKGVDYFEPEMTEKLADTPAVIARIFRGSGYVRKMTISAEDSKDVNNRPLKFFWTVLRGNPDRIKIEYRNPSHSVADITIPYHGRVPISEGSPIESNRVDIGIFVHNGVHYSPPAFITCYSLDNEARTYRTDRQPLEIAYGVGVSTVSITDWSLFFRSLTSAAESWPDTLLRQQFKAEELAALIKLSDEYQKLHAAVLSAQELLTKAQSAQKLAGGSPEAKQQNAADLAAAQRTVSEARKAAQQLVDENLPSTNSSAAGLVQKALDSLLHDPTLWNANSKAIDHLCASAGSKALDAVSQVQKSLVRFNVAVNPDGASFHFNTLVGGPEPLGERLTSYERSMIERFNATLLDQILFPGMVKGDWQENYVDSRITSSKQWRDIYRYASDGTPAGWARYQADGKMEFNAEGELILDRDSQGRCIRARAVKYELEPIKRDSTGRPIGSVLQKVRIIPADTVREYEYQGINDQTGHLKTPV